MAGRALSMDIEKYTHNFHPYPAKFPPQAIRDLILDNTKQGDTVIDPFCGSGTTLVECRLLGLNGIGIELNPVGVLLSRAKSTCYTIEDIRYLSQILGDLEGALFNLDDWLNDAIHDQPIPNYPNMSNWFGDEQTRELTALKQKIILPHQKDSNLGLLLRMAFSKIIVPISNQESETRYAAIVKNFKKGDVLRLYLKTIKEYSKHLLDRIGTLDESVTIEVIEGDSRIALKTLSSDSVDFMVTSPPYINSFDYYLYHKQRIFWLDGNPLSIRRIEIGGHHRIDTLSYEKALSEYSESMTIVLEECFRILKPNKKAAILIGDGIVKGKSIKVDDLIRQIATSAGFEIEKTDSIPLRDVSKRFIKDKRLSSKMHHVILLRKP